MYRHLIRNKIRSPWYAKLLIVLEQKFWADEQQSKIGLLSLEYCGLSEYTILTRRYTPSVPNFGVYACTLPPLRQFDTLTLPLERVHICTF